MTNWRQGSSLIETLIASALFGLVLLGFVSAISSLGISELKSRLRTEAAQSAREAIEIAYNLSTQDWQTFASLDGDYHPIISNDHYGLADNEQSLASNPLLKRRLTITPARRDTSGLIVESGGTIDPTTMRVTSLVYWNEGKESERVVYTTYLTDLTEILKP